MVFIVVFLLLWLPITLLIPTKVINKHNIPTRRSKQGYIIACNHFSNFDPILIDIKFGRKINFLAKKELFKNKLAGGLLKRLGGIKIDRQSNDISAFKNAMFSSFAWLI